MYSGLLNPLPSGLEENTAAHTGWMAGRVADIPALSDHRAQQLQEPSLTRIIAARHASWPSLGPAPPW
jgi:hypothetical protein